MQRMFAPSISSRKRNSNNSRNTRSNSNMSRPFSVKKSHCNSAQIQRGKDIQLEHVLVNIYVDVLPKSALGTTGVVYQDVDGPEMTNGRVEVAFVEVEFCHVHFYDEDVVFLKETS